MSRVKFCTACLLALMAIFAGREAFADRLDLIQKRGILIAGVKSDYPPFGMLDGNARLIGFEPDLAAEIARRLGVRLQLVAVSSTNRLQKLDEGAIDLVVATLADTPQRRQIATLVEPSYYASGATVVTSPHSRLSSWADLRGKKVCATQGAYFNRAMAQRFLLDLQVFNGTRDTGLALRDGRCVAWLYDDTGIVGVLGDPEWARFETPLPSMMVSPWAIALASTEQGSRFEHAVSEAIADWHRSGWLIESEQRWGIKPNHFLTDMRELWTRLQPDGSPLCARQSNDKWPVECRNKFLLSSADVDGMQRFGLLLKEQAGLDLAIIHDAYDRQLFLHGLWVTLQLMVACIAGSLAVGCLGALVAESGIPLLSGLVRISAALGRMTPPLLLIYLVFFGIGRIIVSRFGWTFDGAAIAIFCLSTYTGCAIVSALLDAVAVLKEQEAGFSLRRRNLSQALRLAYAPVVASLVNVVKATAMASVIGVPELVSAATAIVAEQGNPAVMMNVLMITYFLLVMAIVQIFNFLERRMLQSGNR
ncbi:Polar amino acid uptake family ABC transporter, periplasmic substrate-binding protein [Candidatus Accumulibacter aalborgensis]|uniref:Polar amino acid uptake family ABC transporter, periplasmic substrate-binding protein n=1 Tax=Candidatus Accumulibacter aalborgensis TaxID=1860102 RepID=A0A1A8XVF8_9PROT|nr:transporter substrate-binding domain-containing protein [Candidatus Accumulibacter aalborgensis]SBT07958.1 Polar amino acid uptake family ABC transporter, periplasmic substrate-binding protein [Candidatus Accumulibacter aalborgensis]